MPNARPQWRCQAPQPRSGAPRAQGLIAALWSQHNPACRRSLQTAAPTQTTFTGAVALMATSAPAVKLHLLDGRDRLTSNRHAVNQYGGTFLRTHRTNHAPAFMDAQRRAHRGIAPPIWCIARFEADWFKDATAGAPASKFRPG